MTTLALITIFLIAISSQVNASKDGEMKSMDTCLALSSCSSCLSKSHCTWCVNKGKCTHQSCGNDNMIFPASVPALMSGTPFCPKVLSSENAKVFRSDSEAKVIVQLTQLYVYMAFTPWKCKISFGGKEIVVDAVLVIDEVFCGLHKFDYGSEDPLQQGSVSVLWDTSKHLDGEMPFFVCRCDLYPNCVACKTNTKKP